MSIIGRLMQDFGGGVGHLLESLTWLGGGDSLNSTAGTGPGKAGEVGASSGKLEKGHDRTGLVSRGTMPHPSPHEECALKVSSKCLMLRNSLLPSPQKHGPQVCRALEEPV